ncbi:hypothetical protein DPMN_123307 [Dreissena polymorpha]|uniref:Uncharacterized protein n=1 Tax=Dreissena polymorpha TaxID=45954 RepID=A0A9D4GRC2_DREPO|nr:hypothetical protein DPMN_123307 [Dreissena polymorpha]
MICDTALHVQLGKQSSREGVCVAPISDEMLLGHDLLRHFKALMICTRTCLLINGESIPLNTTFRDKPVVAKKLSCSDEQWDIGPDRISVRNTPIPIKGSQKVIDGSLPDVCQFCHGDKVEATVRVQSVTSRTRRQEVIPSPGRLDVYLW